MAVRILVTGATGHLGNTLIDLLLKRSAPANIAALARDKNKANHLTSKGIDVRVGDYSDYASLLTAFAGTERLVLISTSALENVAMQHSNAIRAAKATSIKHIFFTSIVSSRNPSCVGIINDYKKTEDEIISSGITYTILRSGYYMDMLPMFIGDALETGCIYFPAGDGRAAFTARKDIAGAIANILVNCEKHQNCIYELCAGSAYSFHEIARVLTDLAGKPVHYESISSEKFREELVRAQMPALETRLMVELAEAIRSGEAACTRSDLDKMLGHQPTDLKTFLKETYFTNVHADV